MFRLKNTEQLQKILFSDEFAFFFRSNLTVFVTFVLAFFFVWIECAFNGKTSFSEVKLAFVRHSGSFLFSSQLFVPNLFEAFSLKQVNTDGKGANQYHRFWVGFVFYVSLVALIFLFCLGCVVLASQHSQGQDSRCFPFEDYVFSSTLFLYFLTSVILFVVKILRHPGSK